MNKHFLKLLILGLTPYLSLAKAEAAEPMSTTYTLPNGLTVVLTPNPKAPTTSIYHWVKVGSAHETPGITGIAHLFEHMMFRPLAPGLPTFDGQLNEIGGTANANTRYRATVYTTTVPPDQLEKALKIESERFKKLTVSDDTLKVEKEAVRSEYSTKIDTMPVMDLWFTLFQKAYPNHPYGWTIVGERADLDKIQAKDCNTFFGKYYKPNNVGLFIAGDFDVEKIKKIIADDYSDWARGVDAGVPPEFKGQGFVFAEGRLPAQANNLLLGYRYPELTPDTYQTFLLAKHILLDSTRPLARQRLVDERKVATEISPFNTDYDWGLVEVLVLPKADQSFETIYAEFSKLADDVAKLSDAEFNAYLKEFQIVSAENILRNEQLNDTLSFFWGKYGSIDRLSATLHKPLAVTKPQVVSFVQTLLAKNNLVAVASKKK